MCVCLSFGVPALRLRLVGVGVVYRRALRAFPVDDWSMNAIVNFSAGVSSEWGLWGMMRMMGVGVHCHLFVVCEIFMGKLLIA